MPLELRIVGFDAPRRRRIQAVWHRVALENWTFSDCQNVPWTGIHNALWVVDLNQRSAIFTRCFRSFLNQMKPNCPIYVLSGWDTDHAEISSLLAELLGLFGARVFTGRQGFEGVCSFLKQTARKEPKEIIVDVRVSVDGLQVSFADNKKALIPLAQASRLAESDEILWDSIRIGDDRTYITLSSRSSEEIPLPHDVLREFVMTENSNRVAVNTHERGLTAKALGSTLRGAREKMGLTQKDLGARTGTSRWTIHRIEKGVYLPKVSLIYKLSRVVKENIEDLLNH